MVYTSKHSGEEIDAAVSSINGIEKTLIDFNETISAIENTLNNFVNIVYPIGSIYTSLNSTNPSNLFGGTWIQIKDTFLLCAGDSYTAGSTGGSVTHTHTSAAHVHTTAEHTLTINEMPSHNHGYKSAPHLFAEIDTNSNNVIKPNTSGSCKIMTYTSNNTGGGASHSHGDTGSTTPGDTGSSSHLPPYKVVYAWERTA